MLAGQLSTSDVSDVEKELEELLAAQVPQVQLPDVPSHELPEVEREAQRGNTSIDDSNNIFRFQKKISLAKKELLWKHNNCIKWLESRSHQIIT